MRTLSAEEFKQQYGEQNYNMVTATSDYAKNPPELGLFQRIGQDIQGAGEQVRSLALGEGENANKSVLNRATGMAAAAFHAVPQVASEFLPESARKGLEKVGEGVGSAINWLGEKLGNVPAVHNFVINNPEAAQKLIDALQTVTNVGQMSGDILAVGEGVRGVQGGINEVKSLATKAGSAAEGVASAGAKTMSNIGGKVTKMAEKPIPAQVQSALKGTSVSTFDEYAKAGKAATESFKNPTPLEMAGDKAVGVVKNIKEQINKLSKTKSEILERVGENDAGKIARETARKLSEDMQRMGISLDGQGNIVTKAGRGSKISDPSDLSLIKTVRDKIVELGDSPTVRKVDDAVSYLQDLIYKKKSNPLAVKTNTEVGGLVEKTVGELNAKLKTIAGDDYSNVNSLLSDRIGTFNELNKKLGSQGEKGGALMKRVFSPSDAGTKKLFDKVLKLTGVDLVNEATVARFMMETFGDARQVSMLEKLQLPSLSERSLLTLAKDIISKKANTPEKILARARELTTDMIKKDSPSMGKIDPLLSEARKYKSAEEFVRAQELLYHGTSKQSAEAIRKAGGFTDDTAKSAVDLVGGKVSPNAPVSLTLDEATGNLYAGPRPEGGAGELLTFSGKGLKIADEATARKLGNDIGKLKQSGYDGYHTSSPNDEMVETVVFNKEKLKLSTLTKSQLIDIWKKANQ